MVAVKKLYRVLVKTTGSLQPGSGNTFWQTDVLYCGYDRLEAARVYHENKPRDFGGSYGNRCRETIGQSKEIEEE